MPIPNREKDINMTIYASSKIGIISERKVTIKLNSTVFFRPIRFINIPVGTEKIKNQKNTSDEDIRLRIIKLNPLSGN